MGEASATVTATLTSQGADTYDLFLVHTQAMYVERLDIRCPPYGDSALGAALACRVHPLPRQHRESSHLLFCASTGNDTRHPTGSPLTRARVIPSNCWEGWEMGEAMQRVWAGRAPQVEGGSRDKKNSARN